MKDGGSAGLGPSTRRRSYRRESLTADLGAGVSLCVLLIPAGMAYSETAGLPPVAGLYASIVALLVYGILGPSRVLILGRDSSLAPLIAAAVLPLAAGAPGVQLPWRDCCPCSSGRP